MLPTLRQDFEKDGGILDKLLCMEGVLSLLRVDNTAAWKEGKVTREVGELARRVLSAKLMREVHGVASDATDESHVAQCLVVFGILKHLDASKWFDTKHKFSAVGSLDFAQRAVFKIVQELVVNMLIK